VGSASQPAALLHRFPDDRGVHYAASEFRRIDVQHVQLKKTPACGADQIRDALELDVMDDVAFLFIHLIRPAIRARLFDGR